MKKRVFVAFKVPENILEFIRDFRREYEIDGRWLKDKNLHLTLVPPFEIEDQAEVKRKLRNITEHRSLEIDFDKVTLANKGEMLWLKGKSYEELEKFRDKLFELLDMESEQKFIPHITLARSKKISNKNIEHEIGKLVGKFDSVVLMQSHLSNAPAEYEIIFELPLSSR